MSGRTIEPIADSEFQLAIFHEGERKARSASLEDRAAISNHEVAHIACYSAEFAAEAIVRREKACEELQRQRDIVQAKANADAKRTERLSGPRKDESWSAYVERAGTSFVSLALLDGVFEAIKETLTNMNEKNKERNARLDQHEQRIRELETQSGHNLRFTGDWSEKTEYLIGDVCHSSGSAWIALHRSTGVRPARDGFGAQAWGLFVSRGREGRAGRDATGVTNGRS